MARDVVSSFTVQASLAAPTGRPELLFSARRSVMHPWREGREAWATIYSESRKCPRLRASSAHRERQPSCQRASCPKPRRQSGTYDFVRVWDLGIFCMRVGMKIATRFYTLRG